MKIKVEQQSDHYRAECLDLPGSPPCGTGNSPEMAVSCLFYLLLFEHLGGSDKERRWIDYLKRDDQIVVNGEVWKYPDSWGGR